MSDLGHIYRAVPRETLDSLANAYWIIQNIHFLDICVRTCAPFDTDIIASFHERIDKDPFWTEACQALEPGMRAGMATSMTVAESIERRTRKAG